MNSRSMMIASAAAVLLLTGAVTARAEEKAGGDQVRCAGINACKGHGACASAHNECKGKNGCKGQGWTEMKTDKDCTDKGGKVVK